MTNSITAAEQEQLEMSKIQEQLRLERARLADEIGSRFDALSAAANGSNSTSKPAKNAVKSRIENAFVHRPIHLGLGAENQQNGMGTDGQSKEDRRLRGTLVGKRKHEDPHRDALNHMKEHQIHDESIDEESRTSILKGKDSAKEVSGRGNGVNKKKRKEDPFAVSLKARAAQQNSTRKDSANADASMGSTQFQSNTSMKEGAESLQHLSKKARKKLRKQQRSQEEALPVRSAANHEKIDQSKDFQFQAGTADSQADPIPSKPVSFTQTPSHSSTLSSKLSGARFRQINEMMYTTSSTNTLAMIQNDPIKFEEYHDGFREQVKHWPKVPVKQIFELIRDAQRETESGTQVVQFQSNGKAKNGAKKQNGRNANTKHGNGRFAKDALIVDLGAGEGLLAKWLAEETSIRPRVLSYDLIDSPDGFVKGLDVAQVGSLPLPGKVSSIGAKISSEEDMARIVDVAVFCLSLMATNWIDKIREASRIIRPFGELIIAEVTSRFTDRKKFIEIVESLGFQFQQEDTSNTHFIIFHFHKKPSSQWSLPYSSQTELDALVESGQNILKPCIYKRR